ncbi:calcium-binding protein [Poseidonocella sp. HB161398]|uniref:calcium-binding protein n=1 Tax=Poseidonocella sp. HB161398 TaxID=2320855 RepID=UPI0011099184|nr:calcium-binding protein [Poseidonocella sp. HB161398]
MAARGMLRFWRDGAATAYSGLQHRQVFRLDDWTGDAGASVAWRAIHAVSGTDLALAEDWTVTGEITALRLEMTVDGAGAHAAEYETRLSYDGIVPRDGAGAEIGQLLLAGWDTRTYMPFSGFRQTPWLKGESGTEWQSAVADMRVTGSHGRDQFHNVHGAASHAHGRGGDDELWLRNTSGELHGGAGDDRLSGPGRPRDMPEDAGLSCHLLGGLGDDRIGYASGDVIARGGPGDDVITYAYRNIVHEGPKAAGQVSLHGGAGDDVIVSGGLRAAARGGGGDGTLEAGFGKSIPWGGAGADTFVLNIDDTSTMTKYATSRNVSGLLLEATIRDFEPGTDRIIFAGYGKRSSAELDGPLDTALFPFAPDLAEIRAAAFQDGADAVIDLEIRQILLRVKETDLPELFEHWPEPL